MSRPGGGSGHIQVTAVGNPGPAHSLSGQGTMRLELWTQTLSLMCAQTKVTKDKISILCLKCPMYLKLNFSFPGYDIS
jgi:hypothetical protein